MVRTWVALLSWLRLDRILQQVCLNSANHMICISNYSFSWLSFCHLPFSALLFCQVHNLLVNTFSPFSPLFCYIYTHIWYFWYCYLDYFCLCSITERVTKTLLAFQQRLHSPKASNASHQWSVKPDHFSLCSAYALMKFCHPSWHL